MGAMKQIALGIAAMKLHNFCITPSDFSPTLSENTSRALPHSLPQDRLNRINLGSVCEEAEQEEEDRVNDEEEGESVVVRRVQRELLDGGCHFDDVAEDLLPKKERSVPRHKLCLMVEAKGLQRRVFARPTVAIPR